MEQDDRIWPDDGLQQWMYNFLQDHTGDDCSYFAILKRSSVGEGEVAPFSDAEADMAILFKEIVGGLAHVLGSERAAARWLIHNDLLSTLGEDQPILHLEEGDFWTLSLLHALVTLALERPNDPLGLKSTALRESLAMEPGLGELFESALGKSMRMEDWYFESAFGLGGERPIDVLRSRGGGSRIREYLSQLEAGVYP